MAGPLTMLLFASGSEYCVSHPFASGDDCVELGFEEPLLASLREDAPICSRGRTVLDGVTALNAGPAVVRTLGVLTRKARRGRLGDLELDEISAALFCDSVAAAGNQPLSEGADRRVRLAVGRKVERAKLLMLAEPARKWSLAELARGVGSSPFHLTRLFRRRTGASLHQFLMLTRLAIALDRILDGDEDLAGLASELGFSNHSHFSHAFKQKYGMTPTAARAVDIDLRKILTANRWRDAG